MYHYFESRDDLFAATLRNIAQAIDSEAATARTPKDASTAALQFLRARPAFARIVAARALDHANVSEAMGGHPLIVRLTASIQGNPDEVDTRVAAIVALLLSAGAFGLGINKALGRTENDDRIFETIAKSVAALATEPADPT